MVAKPRIHHRRLSLDPSRGVVMSPLLPENCQLTGDGGMQCVNYISWNFGNEGDATLEGGNYAILSAERMVFISFVTDAFKKEILCYL